jgi:hypothetical protein
MSFAVGPLTLGDIHGAYLPHPAARPEIVAPAAAACPSFNALQKPLFLNVMLASVAAVRNDCLCGDLQHEVSRL